MAPQKISDETINSIRRRLELWDLKDEEINEHVFNVIFRLLDKQLKVALEARAYEAYTYLSLLETELKHGTPNVIRNSLINATGR